MSYDLKIRDKVFEKCTHVMAIINATPDSFFSGSRLAGSGLAQLP